MSICSCFYLILILNQVIIRCNNGHCIDKNWICNGQNECGDNSDEKNCGQISCREGQITCSNGDCIEMGWKCDGKRDCPDASDEKGEKIRLLVHLIDLY